jgi:hypothetical protein
MHFSPERRPGAREGAACPDWSVANDARRDRREHRDVNGERSELHDRREL